MMIDTIFFDLGWTLVRPASGDWTFTNCFFEQYPSLCLNDLLRPRYASAIHKAFAPLRQVPAMQDVQEQIVRYTVFYRTFLMEAGLPCSDAICIKLAEDISTNDENMELIETAAETLHALRNAGLKTAVISDTWPNIESQLKALGIADCFDHCTYSYRLGTNKPSPMMYQDALAALSANPRNSLFIDDIPANLEAAEKFHIRSIQSLADPKRSPDSRFPSITKPADLFQLL